MPLLNTVDEILSPSLHPNLTVALIGLGRSKRERLLEMVE
jgi:hypothetical protein